MRLIDKISPKKLKELYWQRKMSSSEIAKIFHYTAEYIRDLLRKYKIRIRTKSEARRLFYNINISKRNLEKLYLVNKISSVEIAKKLKCSPRLVRNRLREYKIPIRPIQEALLLSNVPKYPRHDFSGDLEEKAYLIGFRLGDLYARRVRSRTIEVSMSSSKPNQIKLFKKLFSKYGHIRRNWTKAPNGTWEISLYCLLNNSFNFMIEKKDLIEPWILKNKKYFAAFLAGYADAEGSFCLCGGNGVFNLRSQDKNILHQIRAKLIKLGILLRPAQLARKEGTRDITGTISNKDIWGLWIHRKDALLKLIESINPYSGHADKRKSMKIVKNNVLKRNEMYNNQQDRKYYKLYLEEGIKI